MDYLTEQQVKWFKQDLQNGAAKQTTEKAIFEKRLLDGLGDEIMQEINNPESKVIERKKNLARKLNRKKKREIRRENLRRMLGITKKETI